MLQLLHLQSSGMSLLMWPLGGRHIYILQIKKKHTHKKKSTYPKKIVMLPRLIFCFC